MSFFKVFFLPAQAGLGMETVVVVVVVVVVLVLVVKTFVKPLTSSTFHSANIIAKSYDIGTMKKACT